MGITDIPRGAGAAARSLVDCPVCGTPFTWPPTGHCATCGADLASPIAATIFDVDRQAYALQRRRQQYVEELQATQGMVPTLSDLPPPIASARAGSGAAAPSRSWVRPQTLLAAAGAVLLLAAVIVFIAVTWPTWPASAQVAFVASLTVVGAITARAAVRRQLPVTADAVGVLTIAVAAYSMLAAHAEGLAGLDRIDTALWVAIVAAITAVAARPFTTWAGLRDAPRRFATVAAVVGGGSSMLWLTEAVTIAPPRLALLAVAPTVAAMLLLHGRWVLRPDDVTHHLVRVLPTVLLVGAAATTGGFDLSVQSSVAVALAAVVGLPLLVWSRQAHPDSPWTYVAAVIATVWVVQLATFLMTDVTFGALGLDMPRLVTFSVVAAGLSLGARRWQPASQWRQPVLVATTVAVLPAMLWTLSTWAAQGTVVVEVLTEPFVGWPSADPLTATDLLLAAVALVGGAVVLERLQEGVVLPFVVSVAGVTLLVATVSATAGGRLPTAAPLVLAAAAALAAARWWHRDPTKWAPVAVAHAAAIVLACVDLELFAVTTAAVAAHLLWVATRRQQPVTAAAGAATGLVAVAAASQALDWSTPVTTVLVTAVAGGLMVWAQLARVGGPWRHTATDVVAALAGVLTIATAAGAGEATAVAVQLAIVAVVATVHAARPGRGWAVWLSSVAASAAIWTLLGDRGVEVIEAYTLPAAATLTAAGAWRLHVTETSSWAALWPACLMGSLPTLAILLDGPDPVRVLLLATGAVAVALTGHWRRLAAPLVAGTVVATVAAVLQLHYWTMHLPRWVTFGVLGIALIAASATYETQLRRAGSIRRHLQRQR